MKAMIILVFCVVLGLLLTPFVSAVSITIDDISENEISSCQDFGDIGSMEIDGSKEHNEKCSVVMEDTSFTVNDYIAGDLIKFSADYKIVKDVQGPWEEAPFGEGPDHHPTTIEKWDFIIRAIVDGYEYEIIDEVETILDCPWDSPEEILVVQAPSSVVEGESFEVLVTFQGLPTSHYWGLAEEVTFDGEAKTADEYTGIVSFTAPMVEQSTEFTINAVKDWDTVDDHNPGQGNVLTLGETKITVLNEPGFFDLVVSAPSSVMEKEEFEVTVKADNAPVPGAIVLFNNLPHIANLEGKVTLTSPEVSNDEEYTIYTNFAGFIDGETKITVHSDYDDEADATDESGNEGTITLEFSLPRRQFYRSTPSPEGDQVPMEIEIKLIASYSKWGYKGYPHWYNEENDWDHGYLSMTLENSAPVIEVEGKTRGKVGTSYEYTATATDPDGDMIHYYEFFWEYHYDDEGNKIWDFTFDNDDFTGFNSGEPCTHSHTWSERYEENLLIYAEDAIGDVSVYRLPIAMPQVKIFKTCPFLANLFKRSSSLEKLFELPIFERMLSKI